MVNAKKIGKTCHGPARVYNRDIMKTTLVFLVSIVILSGCGLGPDITKDRVPRSPSPTPWQGDKTVQQNVEDGSAAFMAKDYEKAIKSYKAALEQEKQKPTLEKKFAYTLIDNLAMAYGITGDSNNARVVLAYGLSRDFKYPMFHYILASTYGEEGNESEAILHLRRAFKYKANMLPGEKFPDPLTDESFSSLAENAAFQKAVAEMKSGKGLSQ
jgi:tetratricopeptide (TPR) repeat protein